MTDVRFIYFDLANTLVHQPGFYKSVFSLLETKGLGIGLDEIRKSHRILSEEIQFPDKTDRNFYLKFNAEWMKRMNVESELAEEIFQCGKGNAWEVFEDVDFIKGMKVDKGIISNWDSSLTEKLKIFFDFEFVSVVGSALSGFQKPDSRIFRYALEKINLYPENVLMVGDSPRLDVIPAKNMGMQSVLIDRDGIFGGFDGNRIGSLYELSRFI